MMIHVNFNFTLKCNAVTLILWVGVLYVLCILSFFLNETLIFYKKKKVIKMLQHSKTT